MQEYDVGHYISRQVKGLDDPRVGQLFKSLFIRLSADGLPEVCFKYSAMSALCLKALGHEDARIRVGMLSCMLEGTDIPHVWCECGSNVYDLGIYGNMHFSKDMTYQQALAVTKEWELPLVNERYQDIWFARYEKDALFVRWRMFEAVEDMSLKDYFDGMPGLAGRKCWLQMLEALRLDCQLSISEAGLKGIAATMRFPRLDEIRMCGTE